MAVDFSAIFKAQDRVSSTLNSINRSGNTLESTFKKLAATAAGVFAVDKIVDFGKESVNVFSSFDSKMKEVFTLLPDVSQDTMDQMTAQAKQLGKELGILPDEIVPALYQAISASVPQDNVFEFLETSFKAATGGVSTLETAVDGLTSVVNAYGSDVIDVDKASDLMFTTVRLGKTTFEELASSLFNVNPTAAAAGVAFEDVSAALAAMTAQGVPTSVATTQLRQALVELSKSGTSTDKVFRKVAGKSFKEFIAQGGNMQEAFQLLEKHANKSGLGINDLFGSVEAGNAVLALTGKGTERFTDAMEAMQMSAGATEAAFEKMDTGLKDTFEDLGAKFEWFKVEIGQRLGKAISSWFDKNQKTFDKIESAFGTMFTKIDEGLPIFDAFKIAFKDLIPPDTMALIEDIVSVLGFVYNKAKDIAEYITANWPAIKPVVIGIVGAFAAWKIGTTIYDVVTLGKELYGLAIAIGTTSTAIWGNVTAKIADKAETLAIMALYAGDFVRSIWTSITAIGAQTAAYLVNAAQLGAQSAGLLALKVAQVISTTTTAALTAAQWALNAAFIASPIGWIVLAIGALIAIGVLLWKNWDTVKAKALELWAGIQEAFAPIGEFFAGIWEGVKSGFKSFINFLIKGLNFMIRGLNKLSIDIPDWVPVVGGKKFGFSIPEIPMLAKGTKFAPDTFIAGEEGPELITGAQGARVFPSDDTDRIINALENNNQPISVSMTPFNSEKDMEKESISNERNINININGDGTIKGSGISKDEMLEFLIVHLKPILMSIIETEIFEEGDLAYEF